MSDEIERKLDQLAFLLAVIAVLLLVISVSLVDAPTLPAFVGLLVVVPVVGAIVAGLSARATSPRED